MRKIYSLVIMLMASLMSFAQANFTQAALTPGNLVIYRMNNGAAGLVANGTAIFLDEYTPGGVLVQSIAVPTTTAGAERRVVCSGTATSEGNLTRSTDGQYIIFAGYDAALGTASITTSASATVPRVIGRLDAAGTLNTQTALTDAISGGNPRGACSTNGTDLWISGTSAGGGIRYATLGATTSTSLTTTPTNFRAPAIFDGQLYCSAGSNPFRLATVGTGTPTTTGQTTTNLPGFPTTTGSPYQYFFADMDAGTAGVDVVYVADDGGTIQKYSLVAGTWTANGTKAATSVRGLTGIVNGVNVTLYCTYSAGTKLATLTDNSGYNATIAGTVTDLAPAPANTAFRGIAFAPVSAVTPVLSATPSSLNGFTTTVGNASTTQTFNVNGSNLPANIPITVTASPAADVEVSPSGLAGTFSTSFSFNASGSTVNNIPVYVRLTGTGTQGNISGTINVTDGTRNANVTITGTVVRNFYPLSTGSLTINTNWGTNPDGTGTQPNNFTNDGQVFIVTNRTTETLDANWTVSGSSSKVVVGNGVAPTELIIPAGFTLTGVTDVANLGKLTLQNTTLPSIGTLSAGSTVEYAQASGMSILNTTNDNVTYYNLTLSGAGLKTFKGSTTTVNGNLLYDGLNNGPLAIEAASVSPFTTINLNGNLTYTGSVTNPNDVDSYTLNATGAGTQTITGNGNTARFFRITTGTTNTVALSNVGGTTNTVLGNLGGGGLTLNAGTVFQLNGNNVTFFTGATTVGGTGTITGSALSNMVINRNANNTFGTLNFTTGSEQLNSLTINHSAATTPTVTLGTKLDLSGTLTLTAGKLILGANNLSAATVSGGSSTAYVVTNGVGALKINNIGSAPITYPVGPSATPALYHPATISNTGTIDNYAVKVSSVAPPCADPNYSVTATWDIAEDVVGGSNCTLSLDYTGAATGASYTTATARVIHCNGVTFDYSNGAVVGTVATGTGFTNFSPFGVSMDPLVVPVRIVNLRGTAEGKFNRLSWTTVQENANNGFEIQRSEDGNNFDVIGFVNSAAAGGTSAVALNYTYDDYKATGIKQYYRLRQTDLNGQSRLSNAILINGSVTATAGIEGVYPNPAIDKLNVSVISPAHDRVTLTVSDFSGKKVAQGSFIAEAGKNILSLNISKLASGTYTVILSGSKTNSTSTMKFIKQ